MAESKLCLKCGKIGHSSSSCTAFSSFNSAEYKIDPQLKTLMDDRAQLLEGIKSIRSLPITQNIAEKNERMQVINELAKMITEIDKKIGKI